MDPSSVPTVCYRWSKPLGKMKRRVQDIRIPSSSCCDILASRPALDLSHNESARLAADSLLSRGLEGYHEMLDAEGEVDFLSKLEKGYILEHGTDGNKADPGVSDDADKDVNSLSAGSQSATQCPEASTDSDSDHTVAGLDPSSQRDVKWTDPVLKEPNIKVYFQSDSRAAGMKDLVRGFIRKAGMALAIVMDSFSDVELLCDLLEASRKRNVSVHLLLDHLNLDLFVSMWQDLKLNSKNFPKLSVRSVDGQTYCAKTGRKLTGQIAESFIITDWTEVLTGSYSFSWLSWQVHRSLAVLVKGSTVRPFHEEFLRLNSSSKAIPGFVTFITVPQPIPVHTTLQAAQNAKTDASKSKSSPTKAKCRRARNEDAQNTETKAKRPVLPSPQGAELESSRGNNTQRLHRTGAWIKMHENPPKPLVQQPGALQSVSAGKPKHTVGAVCTHVEPLERNHIQRLSNHLSQTHVSYVQSQLASFNITARAEKNARAQESNPPHTASPSHRIVSYQQAFKANPEHPNAEGVFFRLRDRNRLPEPSGVAAGLKPQRRQWNYSFNFKQQVDFVSDNPKVLPPSTSQQKQAKPGLRLPFSHPRGHTPGLQTKVSSQGSRRQDHLQSHPNTEGPGSKSASSATGAHLKPQLQSDSKVFSHLQPPPRLTWTPQGLAERSRPVTRQSSFNTTYGAGQKTGGQVDWRPFHSSTNRSLRRSKSVTDRRSAVIRIQSEHNQDLAEECRF